MTDDAVTTTSATVREWMLALAESTGSPGGGAASGVMSAIAMSLTSMVAGYTKASDDQEAELSSLHARARARADEALRMADADAAASEAFGSAFRLDPGPDREAAIREASVSAARASAVLGERAAEAIGDLEWLAAHGNPALISDIAVACGALRSAITGARTNVSFDLASLTSSGESIETVRTQHPDLWSTVQRFDRDIARIDRLVSGFDHRAAPTGDAADTSD